MRGNVFVLASTLLLAASAAIAHPYHVTLAEAEFNVETGKLEVALRVTPEDFERALSHETGGPVDLEKTEDIDATIFRYLVESFRVRAAGGEDGKIHWLGKEVELKWAWLYFEVDLPGGLLGAELTNELFFEQFARQLNTVQLKQGEWKTSLSFTAQKSSHVMASGPPSLGGAKASQDSARSTELERGGVPARDGWSKGRTFGWFVAVGGLISLFVGFRFFAQLRRAGE
ncbi:MAG: DUF6702 family protein [Planctomycetota bacterium]